MALSTSTLFMTRCSRPGWPSPSARVDRIGSRTSVRYSLGRIAGPGARQRAEPLAEFIGRRIDRPALGHRSGFGEIRHRDRRRGRRQRRAAGGAELAAAFDLDRKHAIALLAGDVGDLAVIDRLDETRLDQARARETRGPISRPAGASYRPSRRRPAPARR